MDNQRIPEIYLRWLKKNTGCYSYRTPEAKKLQKRIELCDPETDEGRQELEECYRSFVSLSERNPLDGTDENGKDAPILAKTFDCFLYPNESGLYIPLQIFRTMGGLATEEARNRLYNRMERDLNGDPAAGLRGWRAEAGERQDGGSEAAGEEAGYARTSIAAIYGRALNESRGSGFIWLKLLLMIALLVLTGVPVLRMIRSPDFSLLEEDARLAIWFGAAVTLLFTLRTLQWIRREGTRRDLLREWDYCVQYSGGKASAQEGFREPERFENLMRRNILLEGGPVQTEEPKTEEGVSLRLPDYQKLVGIAGDKKTVKKNLKILCTIRFSHLVMMALVFLAVSLAAPEQTILNTGLPASLLREKTQQLLAQYGLLERTQKVVTADTIADYLSDMQFTLRTTADDEVLLDTPGGSMETAWCGNAGAVLYPLGAVWDEATGSFWYYASDESGGRGYIPLTGCRVTDGTELSLAELSLADAAGNAVTDRDVSLLTDSLEQTGAAVYAGESVELRLSRGSKVRYLYLSDANYSSKEAYDSTAHIAKLKITLDGSTVYYTDVPEQQTDGSGLSGIFIPIPDDVGISRIRIDIMELSGGADASYLSEIKVCGQYMQ